MHTQEVIKFHDWILTSLQGLSGTADHGRIDAMVMRVQNLYFYENIHDVFQVAAAYFLAIARGHCFADANKRTAFLSTAIFLDRNNIQLSQNMELVELTVRVAAGEYSREALASYLQQVSEPKAWVAGKVGKD